MQLGRVTVVVEPFAVVLAVLWAAVGLLSDGPLALLAPIAGTLLLARTAGALAAALVVLLGTDGWVRATVGLVPTMTGAAGGPWTRRLEPVAWFVGSSVGVAAVYLASVALAGPAPAASAGLAVGARAGAWFLALMAVPMLPFDGGQVLRELLPGPPARRARVAAAVSVVAGLLLTAWVLRDGVRALAVALLVVVAGNVLRAAGRSTLVGGHVCTHSCDVLTSLYLAGRQAALETHRARARETDPVLALVLERWDALAEDATAAAVLAAYRGREHDPRSRGAYLLWCAMTDRRAEVTALAVDPSAVDGVTMMVAVRELAERGADQQVVLLAERVLHAAACSACVPTSSTTLYSSRSRIRLGDVDRAVTDLSRCRVWTATDVASVYSHPDLAAVRQHPAWPSVQAALPSPA